MATAAATCWFTALTSATGPSRYSLTSQRFFATTLRRHSHLIAPNSETNQNAETHAAINPNRKSRTSKKPLPSSPRKSSAQKEAIGQRFPGTSKDEVHFSRADARSSKTVRSQRNQPVAFKSFGLQKKGNKGGNNVFDIKEQQVETGNFQDAAFLNAVVKVYCTHTAPDYSLPWQKQRQYTSTGSAFMIGDGKLLTNAHCVEHDTQVKVKRRGDDTKYVAKVLARGIECDMALLSVESTEFWEGAEPLHFGRLPRLQDPVTVVGYPLGGDTISVTKGVVSRIEVTSYAHGSSDLLGIQIDAAINPGNSGGPAFNDQGECVGVAFQVFRSDEVENIGYVIPTTVVSHFLEDYERNGKYTGFPCLGVLLQKLENPALRACLGVPSNEGVLVRRVEPTSDASNVLKEGDVIVSFDGIRVGCEGTVPFRSTERIAFRYLISQKMLCFRFAGDVAELGIVRAGSFTKLKAVLNPRVHLVPYHIEGGQPSYLIVAGLVFTPLSDPLIEEECEDQIGLKLLTKARYSLAKFKGEQIVILSQVLANEVNIGYEDMSNEQVLKLNGTRIKNIHHLAYLVDSCKDKYLVFEFEDNYLAVLEREAACSASARILKDYGIPAERSPDLSESYVDSLGVNHPVEQHEFGDGPVSNSEFGFEGLLWV
ncbi:protease Do-like 2, chloroplastic isoform X1 [Coffea eugenioides]|uniref:Protease Do-like 2, chloroplastic isoform X2 n=1 Tax=Coffea arabica TaxID=13443 RepID=A0ABM4VNF5_COFAR|nr:protease Do-like 2, chloroplastic isoform X2 [Coffea arabica]XP_027149391.1 protease Do-like 2, chloroplastic isoform X1 [Coffea eugenioides]